MRKNGSEFLSRMARRRFSIAFSSSHDSSSELELTSFLTDLDAFEAAFFTESVTFIDAFSDELSVALIEERLAIWEESFPAAFVDMVREKCGVMGDG